MDWVHGPERSGAPHGALVAPTRRTRGAHAGSRTDGPDPLGVDRTAEGAVRGRRSGGARQRPAATGRWWRAAASRRRGWRQRRLSGWAVAWRLGGAGEREKWEEGPHRRRSTTASDGGQWRRRDELRNHLTNKRRGVRGREENPRGRERRPRTAAMAVLTGARRGVNSGGGYRWRRGGRDSPHDGERDGVDGAARHGV